jgi:hypothetical protein
VGGHIDINIYLRVLDRSEITVMGRACNLRENQYDYSEFLHPFCSSNELIDGSIVNLCGVSLLFQSPLTMAKQLVLYVAA